MTVRVTIDPSTGYGYIYLADIEAGGVAASVPLMGRAEAGEPTALEDLVLDFDGDGRLVGIEIAGPADRVLPREVIEEADFT